MGADSFVIYFGVRRELSEAEYDTCERKQHAWQMIARQFGLNQYWGNFSIDSDRYILLIGHQLGAFGAEGLSELELSSEEFALMSNEVSEKLRRAGIDQDPAFHCLYEPD